MIESEQYQQNYEQLLSLSPDLIVTQGEGIDTKVYEEMSKTAPTVALNAGPGMHDAMPKLAELFDKKAAKAKE